MNVDRTAAIGYLTLTFDGDLLYATQPHYDKQRRRGALVGPAVVLVDIATFAIGILIVRQTVSGTAWRHAIARHFDWKLLALACALFAASYAITHFTARALHTGRFSIRRAPGAFRAPNGRAYPLTSRSAFSVGESNYMGRRTYVLWLTMPGEEGCEEQRFGLASFFHADEAARAKAEIAGFAGLSAVRSDGVE